MRRAMTLFWQLAIGLGVLAVWQWGWNLHDKVPWLIPDILDPYFVSRPSEIYKQFLRMGCLVSPQGDWTIGVPGAFQKCIGRSENNLWIATYFTLKNTLWGFATGVSPRFALAPIIILAFGIGDASKIVTAWLVVVFLVFFNTFEGARAVDRDHINAARLLGAGEWQVTRTVIVPSTMAWLFASLTPAISFSLIGVIVGEFIGAEHGIGRIIIEAEARGEAAGMMVAVFVLMVVGVILTTLVRRLQAYLLRWRPAQQLAG